MKELIGRLFHRPILAVEILAATFLTTLLTLAMPLYVIQILNRYVSYGFHGTLITLTIGMLIAVILQFGFRIVRTKMATTINQEPNDRLSRDILSIISRAKAEPLDQLSKPRLHEALNQVQTIQQSYDAQTMTAVLDAPFSLIFIGVIYLLSPVLAGITLLGIFLALFFGWLTILKSQKNSELLLQSLSEHRNLNSSAVNALETVRAFVGTSFLFKKWDTQLSAISRLKNKLTDYKELSQTMTMTGSSLTSVFLYAAGAVLVVQGELSVGALIGANILCGKAYQNTTRLVQTAFSLTRAKQAFKDLELLKRIPLEASTGSALTSYQGQIEFQDLGFSYPNTSGPLFESLTLRLAPGNVMAVFGGNGTGKTTLAKLVTNLLEPRRGRILADGVNILQMAPAWWRKQIIYMPQEPSFINGSLRDNILLLNPDLDDASLNEILRKTDLKSFLDKTPNGLDTLVTNNEKNFPPGIRRRLSLARGLAGNGNLVVLDEPTDAMDAKGVAAVYAVMNTLAKSGKSIIVFSNDPNILKGASLLLNLDKKPIPELTHKVIMPHNGQKLS
ncbi:MAG: ATP-binding cassette domain-containing protein [Proteobacteria bacterium]|nr:ATP-binding cassette domain-containing protein [Desulfobacula sp.]MBU4129965.1 ATP-binding cassette domain-containing protein [Pseudomonadota bacterium]